MGTMGRLGLAAAALMGLAILAVPGWASQAAIGPRPGPTSFPTDCVVFDPAHVGEFPTCRYDANGNLVSRTWGQIGEDPDTGSFLAPFFVFGGLILAAMVAGFLIKISVARNMARRAGFDEDAAVAAAVFDQHSLTATYLADSLRGGPAARTVGREPSVEARLRELDRLLAAGLVSQVEHDERHRRILDEL